MNLADAFLLKPLMGLLARRFPCANLRTYLLLGTSLLGPFATYGTFIAEVETATTAQTTVYATESVVYGLPCTQGGLSLGTYIGRGDVKQRGAGRHDQLADESKPEADA